jgi:RNA polymerase sigma factor (sigma-70 family)
MKCHPGADVILTMGPDLFSEPVTRHAAALALYARQWCACPEDVVQTAFLKLAAVPTPPDNLLPFLYRMVRNGAIDAAMADRRRRKYEARAAAHSPEWFEPADDPTGLDARKAAAALADLPLEAREVIVAHLWGGLTFEQIAEAVGSSAATCYRRYAAGLVMLREHLRVPCPKTARK